MRLTGSHSGGGKIRSLASSLSPAWSLVVVIVAMLLVFALDRLTGSAPVQHLYYVPIILAGVNFRIRGGVIAALSSILLYVAKDGGRNRVSLASAHMASPPLAGVPGSVPEAVYPVST